MSKEKIKQQKRRKRHKKIRKRIKGTAKCPRLSVFRSNKGMYLQLIDDEKGKTLVSASSSEVKLKGAKKDISLELGKLIAGKAKDKKIKKAVFDRGGHRYHGRVKAAADGAREGGLEF